MRIGFLADKIPYQNRRGWGVYSYQLLKAILSIDQENIYRCFYAFFRKGNRRFIFNDPVANLENCVWTLPGRLLKLLWEDWKIMAAEDFLGPVDVLHSPYEFLPKTRRTKTVVTVHDVTFLKHPDYLDPSFVRLYSRRIKHIVNKADKIIVDSQNTQKELLEFTNASPDRVSVIHPGVDPRFAPLKDDIKLRDLKRRFGISGPYILFVGAADKDKNLNRLAEAFSRLIPKHDHLQLVFAGSLDWGYQSLQEKFVSLCEKNKLILTGFVNEMDLPVLYSGAQVLAIPSIHEGFGLPAVEAMACGVPVLSSNTSSLPEIVEDAAVQVDPYDVDHIAEGLRSLIEDKDIHLNCAKKGLERAKSFSWENTARQTIKIYKELL